MTIPSQQDFADFATALAAGGQRLDDLLQAARASTLPALDEAIFTQMMCELEQIEHKHWEGLAATTVMAWLDSHATSNRAFKALSGKKKLPPRDIKECAASAWERANRVRVAEDFANDASFISKSHADRAEVVASSNERWQIARRLQFSLRAHFPQRYQSIIGGIAAAFCDYFYTDRYRRMAEEARSAKARIESVRKAIEVIFQAEDDSVLLPIITRGMARRNLERLHASLSRLESEPQSLVMPVRRLDATARERALAFDLWTCFFASRRSSNSKAIYYFMEFEAVERPIDLRSLERMTAEWKAGARKHR